MKILKKNMAGLFLVKKLIVHANKIQIAYPKINNF